VTIKKLLQTAREKIALPEAELLLAHALSLPRERIIAHPEKKVGFWRRKKFQKNVKNRQNGRPVAYLVGHKEFFGLDFLVNRHTLIPRPETELIVEEIIKDVRDMRDEIKDKLLLIDVGTGSGCIPISIMKTLAPNPMWFGVKTFGVDISRRALRVAKKNSKKHKVNIKFIQGNLLQPILTSKPQHQSKARYGAQHLNPKTLKHIFITANLPYLTEEQFKSEKSIQFEPKSALVAKDDGLYLYKKLLRQIKLLVTRYLLLVTCFFEIDPAQTDKIKTLIKQYLPAARVEINPHTNPPAGGGVRVKKDLCGQDRLVIFDI